MRKEYDFSKGKEGKFYRPDAELYMLFEQENGQVLQQSFFVGPVQLTDAFDKPSVVNRPDLIDQNIRVFPQSGFLP